jgi:hypothetical protein
MLSECIDKSSFYDTAANKFCEILVAVQPITTLYGRETDVVEKLCEYYYDCFVTSMSGVYFTAEENLW